MKIYTGPEDASEIVGRILLGQPIVQKNNLIIAPNGGIAKVQLFAGSIARFYASGLTVVGPDDPRYQCASDLADAGKPYDAGLCEGDLS